MTVRVIVCHRVDEDAGRVEFRVCHDSSSAGGSQPAPGMLLSNASEA